MANSRFPKVLGALFILATLALVFCAGGYVGQVTFEPQVIVDHEIRTIEKVTETVIYEPIERVIETVLQEPIEETIVKCAETPEPLRHFQNLGELEQWLENIWVLDIRFDVVNKETSQLIKKFDCEDYAMRLQGKALRDGYIMSFEVIHSVEYNALFNQRQIPNGAIHAINTVILGNEVYYIEPQTREIAFVAYLD